MTQKKKIRKEGEAGERVRRSALLAAQAGLDRKAEDVRVLDVRGLSSYADYIVLMTGDSERQVTACADAVDAELAKAGYTVIGTEGLKSGAWALIDTGDIVVHVFHKDVRGYYDLDGLWRDADLVDFAPTASTAPVVA